MRDALQMARIQAVSAVGVPCTSMMLTKSSTAAFLVSTCRARGIFADERNCQVRLIHACQHHVQGYTAMYACL